MLENNYVYIDIISEFFFIKIANTGSTLVRMLENNYVYIDIISEFFFIKIANGIRTQ